MLGSRGRLVLTAILLVVVAFLLTIAGDAPWLGHGFAGLAGLLAGGTVLVSGARLAGRFSVRGSYPTHRFDGIIYGLAMVLVAGYGLLVAGLSRRPLLATMHGWIGLAIAALASFQVLSSLMMKQRRRLRPFHRYIGYGAVSLTLIEAALGLTQALTGQFRVAVFSHSLLGAMAASALIWLIVELGDSGRVSDARARTAAWLAAACVWAAWPFGGYEYLKVYGSRLKPVILQGNWPWVHEVLMEAKEHLFLFLPVVVATLALTLGSGQDRPEPDRRAAALVTAWLALGLLALMLFCGGFISAAAHRP
jgi:hypothetical protein